jgi:hypothetical protein
VKSLMMFEHEKQSLFIKLCESHALIDYWISEITVFVKNNQSLENELKGYKELSKLDREREREREEYIIFTTKNLLISGQQIWPLKSGR